MNLVHRKMSFSLNQSGRTILVTGASSWIGFAATRMLVSKGARVVMGCRNMEKSTPLAGEINQCGLPEKATLLRIDTTDFESIDQFVTSLVDDQAINVLDVVVLNAGIMTVEYKQIASRSKDNPRMESHMACNVVGHFISRSYYFRCSPPLVRESSPLLPVLLARTDSINYDMFLCNSSTASYDKIASYNESKLNKRLKGSMGDIRDIRERSWLPTLSLIFNGTCPHLHLDRLACLLKAAD